MEPSVLKNVYRTVIQVVLFFWGRDVGVVGSNGTEVRGSACGFPETGDKVKGKEAEGRFVAEGGDGKSTSGREDTTTPYPLVQDTGNSGIVGGPTAHFQRMYEEMGYEGGGKLRLP